MAERSVSILALFLGACLFSSSIFSIYSLENQFAFMQAFAQEICGNVEDDDNDGLPDKEDPDCFEKCDNQIDDDRDAKIDKEDPDCKPYEVIEPRIYAQEICGNVEDDDNDGLPDKEDPDCFEKCDNQIDDDHDGQIDKQDPDCNLIQEPNNQAPVADAGSDKTIDQSKTVTLDGSRSYDPDGNIETYSWTTEDSDEGCPVAELEDRQNSKATFTAPTVDNRCSYYYELHVKDNNNLEDTDSVKVTVDAPENKPPTARAGADQTVNEESHVTLDGSKSTDPEEDTIDYIWTKNAGPSIDLINKESSRIEFVAPRIDRDTTLSFQLKVTDSQGESDTDNVKVIVKNEVPQNTAPIVQDQNLNVNRNSLVNITLEAADEDDGDTLKFSTDQMPLHGSLAGFDLDSGKLTYTPSPNYIGSDELTFYATDGKLKSNTGHVYIQVVAGDLLHTLACQDTNVPSISISSPERSISGSQFINFYQMNVFTLEGNIGSKTIPTEAMLSVKTPTKPAKTVNLMQYITGSMPTLKIGPIRLSNLLYEGEINTVTLKISNCFGSITETFYAKYVPIPLGTKLKFIGAELTQSIQDKDNSIPLIANKRTAFRMYMNIEFPPTYNETLTLERVTGLLTASFVNCSGVCPTPNPQKIFSRGAPTAITTHLDPETLRKNIGYSVNFEIIGNWMNYWKGTKTLLDLKFTPLIDGIPINIPCVDSIPPQNKAAYPTPVGWPSARAFGCDSLINSTSASVSGQVPIYTEVPLLPLNVVAYDVLNPIDAFRFPPGPNPIYHSPNPHEISKSISLMEAMLPVPAISYRQMYGVLPAVYTCGNIMTDLQKRFVTQNWMSGIPVSAVERYFYGVVSEVNGPSCADMPGQVGGGLLGYKEWPTFTHEFGHMFSLKHTSHQEPDDRCQDEGPDKTNMAFPYSNARIGDDDTFGFNILDWQVHPSYQYDVLGLKYGRNVSTYDIMSYCGPKWISDYNYLKLIGPLGGNAADSQKLRITFNSIEIRNGHDEMGTGGQWSLWAEVNGEEIPLLGGRNTLLGQPVLKGDIIRLEDTRQNCTITEQTIYHPFIGPIKVPIVSECKPKSQGTAPSVEVTVPIDGKLDLIVRGYEDDTSEYFGGCFNCDDELGIIKLSFNRMSSPPWGINNWEMNSSCYCLYSGSAPDTEGDYELAFSIEAIQ